ncbi:3-phosphoshikimate 1-carboxyvinyltransferase [Patescibacteria group bacterium]|nr:3-phosphoshikimate 1-carboxyvinyltransferase [Patescibacteria group bacterium]
MLVEIKKSEIFGKIKSPASKSWTHRALILAALAKGKSRIISPLSCDDTEATIDCLRKIGVKIEKKRNFWEVEGGGLTPPKEPLFCRESGTTLRLMAAFCALVKGKCILTGEKSLLKRPIKPLLSALKNLGVKSALRNNSIIIENNLAPLETKSLMGFIGGKTELRGDISSQFVSALLLIAPLAEKGVEIELTAPLESKPYVLMTIEAQKKFGVKIDYSKDLRRFLIKKQNYKPTDYIVEGDWSSAAPFLAAGLIGGKVEVENLNSKSLQADREIIKVFKKMNRRVKIRRNSVLAEKQVFISEFSESSFPSEKSEGRIRNKESELKPLKFNVKDCPDLFPIICILAAVTKGKSEISGIERLRLKESNRLEEMRLGLNKMGIMAYLNKNRFFIEGGKPRGGIIDSKDHRIAMAFAILGLAAEGKTIIKNAECVSKSFPGFWQELKKLYEHRRTKNF